MSKTQERVLTAVGAVLGLLVGFVVFQKVIGNKMIEAGTFVLAVFIGGAVGIIVYTLIKDGIPRLLNRRAGDGPEVPTPTQREPVKARRTEPLRAAGRERPLRSERPLKPRD